MTTVIPLSIIHIRKNKEAAISIGQQFLNINPDFQREYAAWDGKLQTRLIETILTNRAMNPIWTIINSKEDSEEVLDGMHRLITSLGFLTNEFSLESKYFHSLDKEKYDKKKFKDLDADDQSKIRNYNFTFNQLDSSYRENVDKRRDMYEILNRSSRPLNEYEFNKVLYLDFYNIVEEFIPRFKTLNFCISDSEKSLKRGNIKNQLIDIFVIGDKNDIKKPWSSIASLRGLWYKENLGESIEDVRRYLKQNEDSIKSKLAFTVKVIKDMKERNFFFKDRTKFKSFQLVYKFVIGRILFFTKGKYSLYKRHEENILSTFTKEFFGELDIFAKLKCTNRNGSFQQKLLQKIDPVIDTILDLKNPENFRRFPKEMVLKKLELQNYICPMCGESLKDQEYEADHIVSWSSGGKTVIENLQVLKKRCHQTKC